MCRKGAVHMGTRLRHLQKMKEEQQEYLLDKLKSCCLCPRRCKADRYAGNMGRCRSGGILPRVSLVSLHRWEEPCISGKGGSGTVFFTGCSLGCIFCQNHDIASGNSGYEISMDRLKDIFLEQQERGADNINLVTAAHFAPQIRIALASAKKEGLKIPVVYNSSGYENVDTLRMLEPVIDVYLPDFKYMDPALSAAYSGAPDYPDAAKAAFEEMVRQKGNCEFDGDGMMTKGVLARLLLLPGHVKDAKNIVKWLLERFGDSIYISLMSQYTPVMEALPEDCDPLLRRKTTHREYENLIDFAIDQGLANGFIQEGEAAAESFIPKFDGKGVIR